MALPSSGAISLAAMNTEFGLGYSFNSYRGKGSVPASGAISFSQMYGASNITRQPASGDYYNNSSSPLYYYGQVDAISGWRIYWNNTLISNNASSGGTQTVGSYTYYRTTLRSSGGSGGSAFQYYGIYRIGPP